MKNIICIDLTQFNKEKLVEVADKYQLNIVSLVENKDNGICKIYVDLSIIPLMVAYSTKKNKDTIITVSSFLESLKNIEPIVLIKEVKDIVPLTVDSILDKISKSGIVSLSESEKNFLDESK